jgi:response regulator NasT
LRVVIVAFAENSLAGKVRTLLAGGNLPVRGVCGSGSQVLQTASTCEDGGVVVCPLNLPDMSACELMSLLPESFDMLVLLSLRQQGMIAGPGIYPLVLPAGGTSLLEQARQLLETRQLRAAQAASGDPLPHRPDHLPSDQYRPACGQTGSERSAEERKIIEQAKYLLMNRRQISEAEAHRFLQKKSMETGIRMAELAGRIVGQLP